MPLSPAESRLYSALSDYLKLVSSGRAGSAEPAAAENLRSIFVSLDSLSSELAPQLDPRHSHFLESKSYRKAYDYLSALASSGLVNPPASRQSCFK